MKQTKSILALFAVAALLVVGFFAIDGNSQEASMISMPDFTATTEVPSADRQPAASLQQLNDAIVEIIDETKPAVVTIRVTQTVEAPQNPLSRFFGNPQGEPEQRQRQGLGSGVIVSQEGYILTNNHVVAEADEITVGLDNGEEYEGEIIGRDPQTDIAVIKIEADNLTSIEIGDSDAVRVGEMVLAIGSPLQTNLAH